jgi:CRISPR-associated protein Cas5d
MTPSGARGVLEALYWHPQFTWAVREIRVLAPVRTFSVLRNEVNGKMSPQSNGFFADADRTQRHSVCLRDVDYVIVADAVVKAGQSEHPEKFREIFRRRVTRGQCFHRPCLGTREFAAEFMDAKDAPNPIDWSEDLGLMLWDLDYARTKAKAFPLFFHAQVEGGIMRVPEHPIGRDA